MICPRWIKPFFATFVFLILFARQVLKGLDSCLNTGMVSLEISSILLCLGFSCHTRGVRSLLALCRICQPHADARCSGTSQTCLYLSIWIEPPEVKAAVLQLQHSHCMVPWWLTLILKVICVKEFHQPQEGLNTLKLASVKFSCERTASPAYFFLLIVDFSTCWLVWINGMHKKLAVRYYEMVFYQVLGNRRSIVEERWV